jgi:hypothetical protein
MGQEPRSSISRRLLAGLLCVSLLFSSYTIFYRSSSPRMTFGGWGTDHISHANATVLFFYRGCEIYRTPVEELLERDTSDSAADYARQEDLRPNELFRLPERHRPEAPLYLNWAELARVYPPGLYLYSLPEAVALEWTDVPLHTLNAFTLIKYSLIAHLLLWYYFELLLATYSWGAKFCGLPGAVWLVTVMLVVQIQVCFWTVSGFYDSVALLFLVLLVLSYRRRRWPQVILFFALAVFFHYRSLWFFPLVTLAAYQFGRTVIGRAACCCQAVRATDLRVDRRHILMLLSSALLLAVSGFFFVLAYPNMVQFPLENAMYIKTLTPEALLWSPLLALMLLFAILLVRRDWLLLVSVAGVMLFLFNTRQLQTWHTLSLTPLILCSRDKSLAGLITGCVAYGILSSVFFHALPFDPFWAGKFYGFA